jgi:hypothetical protein
MHRSINQIVLILFFLISTLLTAEANNINANSLTETTLPPGGLINNQLKTNNRNIATTTVDVNSCEALYGPCNCKSGSTKCCSFDQCSQITGIPIFPAQNNKCHRK